MAKVRITSTGKSPVEKDVADGLSITEAAEAAGVKLDGKKTVTISTTEVVTPDKFGTRRLLAGETLEIAPKIAGS